MPLFTFTMPKISKLLILLLLFQNCSSDKNTASGKANTAISYYSEKDFETIEKFDSHNHFNFLDTPFIHQAEEDNFRLLNITDDRPFGLPMEDQKKIAFQILDEYPSRVFYATTFSVDGFQEEDWAVKALADLKSSFSKGAIAVKVWKNVGMDLKDEEGKFVMVDHPKFSPIWEYLADNHIPLIGHLGEPKDCWLPLEEMTMKGNRGYYSKHPEYHMYLHPEYPSYEDQINARDRLLEKYPDLKFIGAHLGSLEWSLDELAKRLDKYPNMAVDLARMSNLQHHAMTDWKKTRDFFIKYQDRLIYATDRAIGESKDPSEMKKAVHESRVRDWRFFTTDEEMESSGFEGAFKGLKLPTEVIEKIYRENAEKWITG